MGGGIGISLLVAIFLLGSVSASARDSWRAPASSALLPSCPEVLSLASVETLKVHHRRILEIAQRYRVDPVAIASILTLELDSRRGTDDIQDLLLGVGVEGRDFSFGPAQIKIRVAVKAEKYIAKIEKRSSKSRQELISELATVDGAVRLIGAHLREIQDLYPAYAGGRDISRRPEILGSIYNIGLEKAKQNRIEKGGNPEPLVDSYGKRILARKTYVALVMDQQCDCASGPFDPLLSAGAELSRSTWSASCHRSATDSAR